MHALALIIRHTAWLLVIMMFLYITLQWFFGLIGYFLHDYHNYCCWLCVGEGITQADLEGLELGQSHRMGTLLQAWYPRTTDGVFWVVDVWNQYNSCWCCWWVAAGREHYFDAVRIDQFCSKKESKLRTLISWVFHAQYLTIPMLRLIDSPWSWNSCLCSHWQWAWSW